MAYHVGFGHFRTQSEKTPNYILVLFLFAQTRIDLTDSILVKNLNLKCGYFNWLELPNIILYGHLSGLKEKQFIPEEGEKIVIRKDFKEARTSREGVKR